MLKKYPKASSYLQKRLGANFSRWGAPWLQVFTASSFASSRGEGANKDYKSGVILRSLSLTEAYDQITAVQERKKKSEKVREIRAATSRVDSLKLCKQWYPEITKVLDDRVSGYAAQLCHEEMSSSGNYTLTGIYEPGAVPEDDDSEGQVTLTPVGDGPDVDPAALDLGRFTTQLDDAELAEKDPFRRAGVASFLSSRPEIKDTCKVGHVRNNLHGVSQYLVFYDSVDVEGGAVYKSHWCTCGMATTAGVPCRHFFAAHRQGRWAGFHVNLINRRWQKKEQSTEDLWTYGNASTMVKVNLPAPCAGRSTAVHCPGLNKGDRRTCPRAPPCQAGVRQAVGEVPDGHLPDLLGLWLPPGG